MGKRNGKHKLGSVRIGIYLPPRQKAITSYLAQLTKTGMKQIILEGIELLARVKGVVLENGEIAPEHQAGFKIQLELVKQSKVKG